MLGLQKAFDTVDYVILYDSLVQMGVHPIVWSDKQQVVNVNGVTLNPGSVTCRVFQRSTLWPLLFLCYVNGMVTHSL